MTVPLLTPRAAREQRAFWALLNAMARPGSVARLDLHPDGGELAACLSVLESVLDHEVSFCVSPSRAGVIESILRLTGSRVASLAEADYLLATGSGVLDALRLAKEGTPEFPERGATVVAAIEGVSEEPGAGEPLTLTGPGIERTRTVYLSGFDAECRALFAERNGEPPLGVDLVLVARDGVFTCLSRYTRIEGEG